MVANRNEWNGEFIQKYLHELASNYHKLEIDVAEYDSYRDIWVFCSVNGLAQKHYTFELSDKYQDRTQEQGILKVGFEIYDNHIPPELEADPYAGLDALVQNIRYFQNTLRQYEARGYAPDFRADPDPVLSAQFKAQLNNNQDLRTAISDFILVDIMSPRQLKS